MTPSSIRKVYQGAADRRQMFRMFDRHKQRPSRTDDDATALYAGEWFEIGAAEHDYMFEILPPLSIRGDMFAMREFLTGSVTSVFFELRIDGRVRYFHAYLSGAVREKLKTAEAAAALDPDYERNVTALQGVQPADLKPSDITARLGAPWIPAADVVAFVKETMDVEIKIHHMPELASWTVEARQLGWTATGTSEWGTDRRHAGELLADALNSRVPQIFDTVIH